MSNKRLTLEKYLCNLSTRDDRGEYYNYDNVMLTSYNCYITIGCPLHGNFSQDAEKHKNGGNCPQCAQKNRIKTRIKNGNIFTKDTYLQSLKINRTDKGEYYDYNNIVFINIDNKITINCPVHGEFTQNAFAHKIGKCCPICESEWKDANHCQRFYRLLKDRSDYGEYYDYSKVNFNSFNEKVEIICPVHNSFWQTPKGHINNHGCRECGKIVQVESAIASGHFYTTETYLDALKEFRDDKGECYDYSELEYNCNKIKIICPIHKEFLQNPTEHLRNNHGCPACSSLKRRQTNLKKYNVSHPMKDDSVKKKNIESKTTNGTSTGNSSKEAIEYFRNYVNEKNYNIDQVAYFDKDNKLFEWGYGTEHGHIFYDFVAFEKGYRGKYDKIIEIVEYHGPWHYTKEDSLYRPNDRATPWKENKTTIGESYAHDLIKYNVAKRFTNNVNIIWAEYHKRNKNES